jgi:pimeloyl-ACP methyl ester carboxylesterase
MKFFLRRVLPVLFLVVVLLANSTAAFALERKDNDSKGQYTVKDPRNYPIIFIPGMAGSKLDIEGGANAWPGSLNLLSDEAFKVLALKSDGKSPLYGTKVIPTDTIKFGLGENPDEAQMVSSTLRSALTAVPLVGPILGFFVDEEDALMFPVYQGFYTYMEEQGYKLNENPETGKVFFDFPYDFRQDNRNWTSLLDKKVNEVRKKTGSDKVILVGHSMGGIQARLYMKDANRAKKVAAVVFMGTPHHGAPMAFYSFTEGYNFDNSKLSDTRMWEIAANWAGGYQLMPDYPFILDGNDPSRRPVGIEAVLKENWISSQEYARYLEAKAAGKDYEFNRGFPNDKFAADSIKFSDELGDSVDKYPGVKYYMIRGTNQKTVQYLVAYYVPVPGLTEDLIRFDKQFYPGDKGDGTVPLEGALVDGLDGVYEVESGHGDIPNNAQAQELLTGIRKQVNNEDYRKELVDKATTMAGVKMASFSKGGFSGISGTYWV